MFLGEPQGNNALQEAPQGSLDRRGPHTWYNEKTDGVIKQYMFPGAAPSVKKHDHVWGGCQDRRGIIVKRTFPESQTIAPSANDNFRLQKQECGHGGPGGQSTRQ